MGFGQDLQVVESNVMYLLLEQFSNPHYIIYGPVYSSWAYQNKLLNTPVVLTNLEY